MVFKLAGLGYIKYDRYEIILLTDKGRDLGRFLLTRHNTIDKFLKLIGISDSLAETEMVEHSLNAETVDCLNILLDFFRRNQPIMKSYNDFRQSYGK